MKWHSLDVNSVLKQLKTRESGLTSQEAANRLGEYGENALVERKRTSPWKIFLEQFWSILIIILIIAALIAALVGEILDGGLIIAIVIANGIFGFVQDYKAERSIEALKKLSTPHARVLRDGRENDIPANYLVPGDIVVLEEGYRVPADGRIIQAINMAADEAPLTGESAHVSKSDKIIEDAMLPERKNMVYMNTDIVRGRGMAVVVSTGMKTEIGLIAEKVQEIEKEKTPFQKRVGKLGKDIGTAIMIISVIVFFTQFLIHAADLLVIFLIAVSLAVAAVPEGLPAVTTLSLALGLRRMGKRNALVRRLPVVEGLGSVDVICSDKTGTITEGKMQVRRLYVDGFQDSDKVKLNDTVSLMLTCSMLCNNATVDSKGNLLGDPTEKSLLAFAKEHIEDPAYKRLQEMPFSSERKMMSTINESGSGKYMFSKGAPEVILDKCTHIMEKGKIIPLSGDRKEELLKKNEEMASQALRVLGFAYKPLRETVFDRKSEVHNASQPQSASRKSGVRNIKEENLIFLGLEGMIDAARKEVKEAIKLCRKAGIRVVMITGDNAMTAKAIAKDVGIDSVPIEGKQLDKMIPEELSDIIEETNIFARVSPSHKVMILNALKEKGHTVAMTGDGVNDAPALKAADVGVSMGIKGTDVAKETSDMILLDDNFATIVNAVSEGRRIFDNVRKFVTYLLGANIAEVLVVFIGSVMGHLPLAATHLLWINLLTDGFPALALGADPASPDVMNRKPRREDVIDRRMIYTMGTISIAMTIVVLYLFFTSAGAKAQTMAFTGLVIFELVKIQVIRSQYRLGFLSNKYLIGAIIASLALQLAVLYTPLSGIFHVVPLDAMDWIKIMIGVAISSGASWLIIRRWRS